MTLTKQQIKERLDVKKFYSRFLPDLEPSVDDPAELKATCPFPGDPFHDLVIKQEDGMWACIDCDLRGNLLEFYMRLKGKDAQEALDDLERFVLEDEEAENPKGQLIEMVPMISPARKPAGQLWIPGGEINPLHIVNPLDIESCLQNVEDLLKKDFPEKLSFFPWLTVGSLNMAFGTRGIGKTWFNMGLSYSIITGHQFMKWTPTYSAGVLLVDGEMLLRDLKDRFSRFFKDDQPLNYPFKILSQEDFYNETKVDLNLNNEAIQVSILQSLGQHPEIRVLILDNISSLFMGSKENEKDAWERVLPFFFALRNKGITLLLVHHAGKSGDQRGTSGREDHLDTVIKLEELPEQTVIKDARFIVRFTKSRHAKGEDIEPIEAKLDFDQPDYWKWRPYEDSYYHRMISLIRDEGINTGSEMAEALGVSRGYVSKLKRRGIRERVLRDITRLVLANP